MNVINLGGNMGKKELIREAAVKVIAREGFYNTKMQTIAEEAGVAIGTLYLYFKNKEDILDYIFKVEFNKRLKFIDSMKDNNMTHLKRIDCFLMFHVRELKNNPDIAKVLIQEAVDPSLQHKLEWVNKIYNGLHGILSQMLENAKENGEIRDIDTGIISTVIFSSLRSIVYKMLKEGREDEYDNAISQIITLVINGIKNNF